MPNHDLAATNRNKKWKLNDMKAMRTSLEERPLL